MPIKLPFGSMSPEADGIRSVGLFGPKKHPKGTGRSGKVGASKGARAQHKFPRQRFSESFLGKPDLTARETDRGYQRRARSINQAWDDYTQRLWGARSQQESHRELSSRQAHGFFSYLMDNSEKYGLHPEEIRQAENNMFGANSKMRPKRNVANDNDWR